MVTNAGGGFSRWRGLAVTRWREDATRDHWGIFCYLRDAASGRLLVDGLPADAARAAVLRGDLLGRQGGVPPAGRRDRDAHRDRGLARGRRRGAAAHADQPGDRDARARGDQLRRDRPGAAGGRRGPPGLQQPVRRDRVRRRSTRRCSPRAARARPRRSSSGSSTCSRSHGRAGAVEYETDRARFLGRGRTPRAPAAVTGAAALEHDGRGARPDRQPAPARAARAGRERAPDFYHGGRRDARGGARAGRQVPRRRAPSRARWSSPGRTARSSCATSTSRPTRPHLFQRLAAARSTPTPSCARRATCSRATPSGSRASGPTASPATCPIVLVRVAETSEAEIVRQLLLAHEYWRLKGLPIDLVILNEHPSSYVQALQSTPQPVRDEPAPRR